MPIISTFYGIVIRMYWDDHAPPHFSRGICRAANSDRHTHIRTLGALTGTMSPRALSLILEWAQEHQDELMENWELCQRMQPNKDIAAFIVPPINNSLSPTHQFGKSGGNHINFSPHACLRPFRNQRALELGAPSFQCNN